MDGGQRAELGRRVLGERVRRERIASGHESGRDFAELVGISPGYLSDLEHGRRLPTLEVLDRIAQAVGSTVHGLLAAPPWGPGKPPDQAPHVADARRRTSRPV